MTANVSIELFRYALEQMVEKKATCNNPYTDSFLPSPQPLIIWR